VLVGTGLQAAALTDGVATIGGSEHRWSTVGLTRFAKTHRSVLAAAARQDAFDADLVADDNTAKT